jgi:heme exporter protein A
MIAISEVQVRDLACRRGERGVFEHVTVSAEAGRLLSLEGPNGAGKTTLLRALAGFLAPIAGTIGIRTNARTITEAEERGRQCAWLGHQDGIKAQLTVAENARCWAALYASRANVAAALDRVGLALLAEAPAQYLSAGQRRRLALARLLLSARPIWLLDEPLAALDAAGRTLVADLVRERLAQGGIVIAATHEPLGLDGARFALGFA